jgi:hypothetical protein
MGRKLERLCVVSIENIRCVDVTVQVVMFKVWTFDADALPRNVTRDFSALYVSAEIPYHNIPLEGNTIPPNQLRSAVYYD